MKDDQFHLIVAQVTYLLNRGWKSDGSGLMAKPGSDAYCWDLDHAILCENSPDKDKITGFKALV